MVPRVSKAEEDGEILSRAVEQLGGSVEESSENFVVYHTKNHIDAPSPTAANL